MKAPKMPYVPAPDPVATSKAQGASNVATGTASQTMNMVDQYTPDGSLKYKQIGTMKVPDGFGGTMSVPRFSATTSLSPTQKRLMGVNDATEYSMATTARDQAGRIGKLLGTNLDFGPDLKLDNEATEARLYELGSKRLDPRFARDEETLRTQLANSGIKAGSAAFDAEMSQFGQGKNDAYNNLLLTGRGQAVNELVTERNIRNQEMLTERNQPINEISALMGGSQVSMPQFVNAPQTNVAGVDYSGMVQHNYDAAMNQAMQGWQAKVGQQNAMMGGLFGLGGTAATAAFKYSDRRLKRDIEPVDIGAHGLPVYEFRYLWSDAYETGYMADEVERVRPDAVITLPSGFKAVDYAKLEGCSHG